MKREKYLAKMMSYRQKEVYAQIIEEKRFIAKGSVKATCKILMQLGLIIQNHKDEREYELNGKPLNIPFIKKLPLVKDVVREIADAHTYRPIVWSSPSKAPTVYSNTSREQHVTKWLSEPVKVEAKKFTPVKCLDEHQMEYILAHFDRETPQQMADHLDKERYEVILFCQANAITPLAGRKIKDNYHVLPVARQQRLSRKGLSI